MESEANKHDKSYSYMTALIVMSDIAGVDMTSASQWSQSAPHHAWPRTVPMEVVKSPGLKVPISRVLQAFVDK